MVLRGPNFFFLWLSLHLCKLRENELKRQLYYSHRSTIFYSYVTAICTSCINHVKGLMLVFFLQGTKIIDESHDQDTTDLHKCVTYIRDLAPKIDGSEVSWILGCIIYFLIFVWREVPAALGIELMD